MNIEPEIKQWMESHAGDDITSLRLKVHGKPQLEWAVTQLDCRRRCRKKLPSLSANPDFVFPSTLAAEQATSELLAEYHASLIGEESRVLDMTCGLGVDAFALAKRGKAVTAIEIDPQKADTARHNAVVLALDNIEIVCADSVEWIKDTTERYDVIFIDPARRSDTGRRLFSLQDCAPDVTTLVGRMLEVAPRVIIKASPMLDVTEVARELPDSRIVIVGTRHECKELVIICGDGEHGVETMTLLDSPRELPQQEFTGTFLYEPWPAEMKSPLRDRLAEVHGVTKISDDTHLFLSPTLKMEFPGEIYEVVETVPFSKRGVADVARRYPRLSVATRGLGMTADELRRRLKVGESDRMKLFGVKDSQGKRLMIVTRLISGTHAR